MIEISEIHLIRTMSNENFLSNLSKLSNYNPNIDFNIKPIIILSCVVLKEVLSPKLTRDSRLEMICKTGSLKNLAKCTGKHRHFLFQKLLVVGLELY